MRFLSVYMAPDREEPPTQEEITKMAKLIEEGKKSGALLAVEGCMPSSRGAQVWLANGKLKVTDGPFTEATEVIAGFALIEVASKEEALEFARKFLEELDGVGRGRCEVRQLYSN